MPAILRQLTSGYSHGRSSPHRCSLPLPSTTLEYLRLRSGSVAGVLHEHRRHLAARAAAWPPERGGGDRECCPFSVPDDQRRPYRRTARLSVRPRAGDEGSEAVLIFGDGSRQKE